MWLFRQKKTLAESGFFRARSSILPFMANSLNSFRNPLFFFPIVPSLLLRSSSFRVLPDRRGTCAGPPAQRRSRRHAGSARPWRGRCGTCAPIGLSIGSQTAEEIALSILAQIVSIKNARPQTEGFSSALLEAMAQTDAAGQQAALAVIAARHGSTPREIGAKMLVRTDGSIVGSVGGGIMEHRTILAAQEMLTGAAPAYQRLHFSADGKNDDAAIAACGGSMEIVLTRLQPGEEIK